MSLLTFLVPVNYFFTKAFLPGSLTPEATSFFDAFVLIYNNYVLHKVKG